MMKRFQTALIKGFVFHHQFFNDDEKIKKKSKKYNNCKVVKKMKYQGRLVLLILSEEAFEKKSIFLERLKNEKIRYCYSPVHCPDVPDKKDEEIKNDEETSVSKKHIHILLRFDTYKTVKCVIKMIKSFNIFEIAESGAFVGLYRPLIAESTQDENISYFLHIGKRKKQQFSDEEIEIMVKNTFGLNVLKSLENARKKGVMELKEIKHENLNELISFVQKTPRFSKLVEYARGDYELLNIVASKTYFFNALINDREREILEFDYKTLVESQEKLTQSLMSEINVLKQKNFVLEAKLNRLLDKKIVEESADFEEVEQFDIFGTDSENLESSAHNVYSGEEENKINEVGKDEN